MSTRNRSSRPTLIDVAELSGVSKSTVSNVIRNAPYLAAETRARVLQAIEDLGYRPNVAARELVLNRTTTVGLVAGDIRDPFYSELARALERRASKDGYAALVCHTDGDPAIEYQKLELLLEHRVAGILFTHFTGENTVEHVNSSGIPIVGVSTHTDLFDTVTTADAVGVGAAVEHLIQLGHTRIGFVTSPAPEESVNNQRRAGWLNAMASHSLALPPEIIWAEQTPTSLAALFGDAQHPTALIVTNDVTALHLIEAIENLGLSVPDDISVVGHDDIPLASLKRLSLTTVRQDAPALADIAVERLLERISKDIPTSPPWHVQLSSNLIVRGTTGPCYSAD